MATIYSVNHSISGAILQFLERAKHPQGMSDILGEPSLSKTLNGVYESGLKKTLEDMEEKGLIKKERGMYTKPAL